MDLKAKTLEGPFDIDGETSIKIISGSEIDILYCIKKEFAEEIVKRINDHEELDESLKGANIIYHDHLEKLNRLTAQNRELVKGLKEVLGQFQFNHEMELEFDEKCEKETVEAYVRGKKKGIEVALSALESICLRLGIKHAEEDE